MPPEPRRGRPPDPARRGGRPSARAAHAARRASRAHARRRFLPVSRGSDRSAVRRRVAPPDGRTAGLDGGGGAAVASGRSSLGVVADSLAPDAVRPLLSGRFGEIYRYEERCLSTQRLLQAEDPEGAVAVAEEQSEGRGR